MDIREKMLPVLRPVGGEEEVRVLREVIESGWWGRGQKVRDFEERFAEMVGARHAIALTSNTHGQDLIYKALDINGYDVISPTMSFITTGIVPVWNNCRSLLCDIDRRTLNICPFDVKQRLTAGTRAVVAVNMAGVPADIKAIRKEFGGLIIEDTAHSCYVPGAGRQGDVAVWSFQAVKTMPCGDGGMITTDDDDLAKKIRDMIWLGVPSTWERVGKKGYSWDYEVTILGYKAYMIDIMAAICLVQMDKLEETLAIRRHVQSRYSRELMDYLEAPVPSGTVQYYCARVKDPADRDPLIDYLAHKKIHTSVHFKPLHLHPILKQKWQFPRAEAEWKRLISLPCHAAVTDADIDYVVYWIKKYFEDKQ